MVVSLCGMQSEGGNEGKVPLADALATRSWALNSRVVWLCLPKWRRKSHSPPQRDYFSEMRITFTRLHHGPNATSNIRKRSGRMFGNHS